MNSSNATMPDKLRGVHESSQDLVPWSPIQTPSVLKDGHYLNNSEMLDGEQRDS